jgi:Domain of unknown function (DUF4265)
MRPIGTGMAARLFGPVNCRDRATDSSDQKFAIFCPRHKPSGCRQAKFTGDFVGDFIEVIERGGHSTYMLLIPPAETRLVPYWGMLERLGCSYESMNIKLSVGRRLLYSVDVPPTTDIYEVYEMLERGQDQGVWMFQEGYAHIPHSPTPTAM